MAIFPRCVSTTSVYLLARGKAFPACIHIINSTRVFTRCVPKRVLSYKHASNIFRRAINISIRKVHTSDIIFFLLKRRVAKSVPCEVSISSHDGLVGGCMDPHLPPKFIVSGSNPGKWGVHIMLFRQVCTPRQNKEFADNKDAACTQHKYFLRTRRKDVAACT